MISISPSRRHRSEINSDCNNPSVRVGIFLERVMISPHDYTFCLSRVEKGMDSNDTIDGDMMRVVLNVEKTMGS